MKRGLIYLCLVLTTGWLFTGCTPFAGNQENKQPRTLKPVDKKTLTTLISRLYQALRVKQYSAETGLKAIRPYLSAYKVAIPGFSRQVPYDESYLYVYCIYNTKETPPKILSYRFELPKPLQQQLTVTDIKKLFPKWKLKNQASEPDNTTVSMYNAGEDMGISIIKQLLPGGKDSVITNVTVYH